jgi:hypothetical protein
MPKALSIIYKDYSNNNVLTSLRHPLLKKGSLLKFSASLLQQLLNIN